MASASAGCHLGLLHMRPLQLWLKSRVPWTAWTSGRLSIVVNRGCIEALMPWRNPDLFSWGVPLGSVASRVVVTSDASTHGWGTVSKGMLASGLWSEPQSRWHINCLELEAVFLALKEFRMQLEQQHVLIRTENTSVVSYINHQGGIRSRALCKQATNLLLWADCRLSIRAAHIPGLLNCGVDMFSRKGIPQGEWRLHPELVRTIWNRYGRAEVDLFATSENTHCLLFLSLSHSPLEGDALASSQAVCISSDQDIATVLCATGVMQDHSLPRTGRTSLGSQTWKSCWWHRPGRSPSGRICYPRWAARCGTRAHSYGAFMCGCFRVIRGAERLASQYHDSVPLSKAPNP